MAACPTPPRRSSSLNCMNLINPFKPIEGNGMMAIDSGINPCSAVRRVIAFMLT